MKNVRIAIAAFALLFAAGAQAQEIKKEEIRQEKGEFKKDKAAFDQALKLTPEQQAKMKDIRSKYATKSRELREARKEERKKEMTSLHEQREAEVKAVLTADQYKSYVEFREKRKARMQERHKDGFKKRKSDKKG